MTTQASIEAMSYTSLVCRNHALSEALHWHNAVGLEAQSASPLVHLSMCQIAWSSKGLEGKRSIPLASMCTQAARESLCKAGDGWKLWKGFASVCESVAANAKTTWARLCKAEG